MLTRTMPMPIITTGLDKRLVADDATPWTVFAAELATEPIVFYFFYFFFKAKPEHIQSYLYVGKL